MPNRNRSTQLDVARGIAILLVVALHLSQVIGNGDANAQWIFSKSKNFFDFGARGVQLFFMLSAYGLAISYTKDVNIQKTSFYLRRFFRIYPIWIFAVIIYAYVYDKNALISQNLNFEFGLTRSDSPNPEIVPGSWSLFTEITFYLVFPFIFPLVRNLKLLLLFTITLIFMRFLWLNFAEDLFNITDRNSFVGLFPISNFYTFMLGLTIYSFATRGSPYLSSKGSALSLFLLLFLIVNNVDQVLQVITMCYLLYVLVSRKKYKRVLFSASIYEKMGNFMIMVTKNCGKTAYSIYLFYFMLLDKLSPFLQELTADLIFVEIKFMISTVILLPIILVLGNICYFCLEKPSINVGKRIIEMLKSQRTGIQ